MLRPPAIPVVTRYSAVLFLLAAAFTFAMIAPAGGWARVVSAALQGGAVLAALSRAGANRRLALAGAGAVAVTVGTAAWAAFGGPYLGGISDLVSAAMLVMVPTAIVLEFRRGLTITVQSVMAALCIYLVLGMFFASLASAVGALGGEPYFAGRPPSDRSEYTYFSFVTLATVGYGDFVPASPTGRALAVLEGLTGQLYLVTVVALVVSNVGNTRRS